MSLTGLPDVLRNIVESVLCTHHCKTWNLFNEENGNITLVFEIRFAPSEIVQGQGQAPIPPIRKPVSNQAFRKKSEKQICQDKQRAFKRMRKEGSDMQNSPQDIESERKFESFVSDNDFRDTSFVVEDTDSVDSPNTVHSHSLGVLPSEINELDEFSDIHELSVVSNNLEYSSIACSVSDHSLVKPKYQKEVIVTLNCFLIT